MMNSHVTSLRVAIGSGWEHAVAGAIGRDPESADLSSWNFSASDLSVQSEGEDLDGLKVPTGLLAYGQFTRPTGFSCMRSIVSANRYRSRRNGVFGEKDRKASGVGPVRFM